MRLKKLLQGSQVYLSTLTEADLATVARWYRDVEFMRLLDARPANPKRRADLDWLEDLLAASDAFVFAIRRVENDALIGYIELEGILWSHQTAGFAIALGPHDSWGHGYGTEAARLALDFAFDELNLHRVQATVFSYNRRSMAMCEKLGFKREGVFREFVHRDGKRHDMLLYGLLRPEWEAWRA